MLGALRYRYIGPVGNRVTSVVGMPGQPNIYYVGAARAASGRRPTAAFTGNRSSTANPFPPSARLAIAPSDPNIVWAGTGEPGFAVTSRSAQGIYKSTDAGKTWKLMGLEKTGRISRIVIDPKNPDIVLVGALGHAYGPQQERGVFRTTDGGKTWERVLFADENTGCVGYRDGSEQSAHAVCRHVAARDSHLGTRKWWTRQRALQVDRRRRHLETSYRQWSAHAHDRQSSRMAIANSNPNRVYALIETGDGVPLNGKETDRGKLWRSDDGGDNWRLVSYDRNLGGRTHYYFRMAVAPDNENETYFLTAGFARSIDGGETLRPSTGFGGSPGGDNHDIWIDPTNAEPHGGRERRRRFDLDDARPDLVSHSASDRADVSRHGR